MSKTIKLATLTLLVSLIAGCSIANRQAGIPNRWQKEQQAFQVKTTTEQDVLDLLGPPSHLMEIHERTVFYYLLEKDHTEGLYLGVFNYTDTDARFDRAIFIFSQDRLLEEFAVSPREDLEGDS